jgi:hypothetical protein
MKEIYVCVKGGLGMNFALARVIQAVQKKDDKVKFSVLSPYYDIFQAAGIDYYRPEEIRDFIFDAKEKKAEIVAHRIYDSSRFIFKELNYKNAWLEEFGYKDNYITDEEYNKLDLDVFKYFPGNVKLLEDFHKALDGKKFYLVQFAGGQSPLDAPVDGDWTKKPYDYEHEPLKRHYPKEKATEFVKLFKEAHPDIELVQYALPNEPIIDGCLCFALPYMMYYVISHEAEGVIAIDSSLAHIATGQTKVVTIWGHSLPDSFGYSCNKNIIQKCRREDILYFTDLGPSGAKITYIEPDELLNEVEEYFELIEKEEKVLEKE